MPPQVATLAFALGIWALFVLDRDRTAHTSKALWLPVFWLLIAGSRPVSQWLSAIGLVDGQPLGGDPSDLYLDGSPLDRNISTALLALGIIVLFKRRRQVARVLRVNKPILLLLSYCAVSTLWSDYPDVSFKRWIKAAGSLVMVMIVITDPDRRSAIKRFVARTGFLLVPISVLLIKYYPELGRGYNRWTGQPMYTGVTTGKNMLGMTCLVCGLGFGWRLLEAYRSRAHLQRNRHIVVHGVLLAMVLWLFWMANSMTSLSCFLLALCLMVVTSTRTAVGRPFLVHLLVTVMVSVCLLSLFSGLNGGTLAALGRDPTLTGRTDIWDTVLRFSGNPILGAGFETFWLGGRLAKLWEALGQQLIQAHDGYLELYLNLGWVGVVLLAVVLVTGYQNAVLTLSNDPYIGAYKLSCLVTVLIYNFTEAAFLGSNALWITCLLAMLAVPKAPLVTAPSQCSTSNYSDGLINSEPEDVSGLSVGICGKIV